MSYKEELLGDYIDILSGFAFKTKDFVDKGVPIIKIKNISPPCVTLDDLTYVSNEVAEKQKKFILSYDDVLIAMTGSHINQWASVVGRVARVKYSNKTLLNQRVGKITIKNNAEADIDYIYYYLSLDTVKIELAAKAGGAANQANISPAHIKGLSFPCPDLATQKKIGSTLRFYDDLIENNQKQIKLLEEAAQRLYKEWFVNLHFPGYENVKLVDGVPEGWENVPLRNMISFDIGGGWGKENIKEKNEKPAYVIRGTDFYGITHGDMSSIPFRYHTESNLSARILQDGDIVFEVSGGSKTEGVARTLLIRNEMLESYGSPVICASFCKLLRVTELPYSQYVYDTFQFLRYSGKTAEFDKKSASSIVNYRWKDFLAQQNILVPPHSILDTYNCLAESFYHQIINHSKQIESLKNARDRLLPKLMSGEIEV